MAYTGTMSLALYIRTVSVIAFHRAPFFHMVDSLIGPLQFFVFFFSFCRVYELSHSTGCFFWKCCNGVAVLLPLTAIAFKHIVQHGVVCFLGVYKPKPVLNSWRHVAFLPNELFSFPHHDVSFFLSTRCCCVVAALLLRWRRCTLISTHFNNTSTFLTKTLSITKHSTHR